MALKFLTSCQETTTSTDTPWTLGGATAADVQTFINAGLNDGDETYVRLDDGLTGNFEIHKVTKTAMVNSLITNAVIEGSAGRPWNGTKTVSAITPGQLLESFIGTHSTQEKGILVRTGDDAYARRSVTFKGATTSPMTILNPTGEGGNIEFDQDNVPDQTATETIAAVWTFSARPNISATGMDVATAFDLVGPLGTEVQLTEESMSDMLLEVTRGGVLEQVVTEDVLPLTGTAGEVVKVASGGASYDTVSAQTLEWVNNYTLTGATVDIEIPATGREFLVVVEDILPSATSDLTLRFSINGGTIFRQTANDYSWVWELHRFQTTARGHSDNDTITEVAGQLDGSNASPDIKIWVWPGNGTVNAMYRSEFTTWTSSSTAGVGHGAGRLDADTTRATDLQLGLTASATFTSGTARLYYVNRPTA